MTILRHVWAYEKAGWCLQNLTFVILLTGNGRNLQETVCIQKGEHDRDGNECDNGNAGSGGSGK